MIGTLILGKGKLGRDSLGDYNMGISTAKAKGTDPR